MPFGVLSGVPDLVTHAKFYANRLRSFSAATPRKVPFPILFRTTLTTVLHYRADCDVTVTLFKIFKVTDFGTNTQPLYDSILANNTNFHPIRILAPSPIELL